MLSKKIANAPVGKTLSVPVWSWFGAVREMFFSFSQRKKCLLSRVHLLPRSSFGRPRWLPLTVNRAWHSIDPRISFSERIPLTCGRKSACEHSLVFKRSCTDQRVLKVSSRVASMKPISGRLKKKNISGTDCVYLYLVRSIQWYWRLGYQKAPDG